MANPSQQLARSETFVDVYQDLMTQLEIEMDELVQGGDDTQEDAAALRIEINKVRALIGFWRSEVSFWRDQVQQNNQQVGQSNVLAKVS